MCRERYTASVYALGPYPKPTPALVFGVTGEAESQSMACGPLRLRFDRALAHWCAPRRKAVPKAPSGWAARKRQSSGTDAGFEDSKGEQLKAVGISRNDASDYESIAAIPEEVFEEEVTKADASTAPPDFS